MLYSKFTTRFNRTNMVHPVMIKKLLAALLQSKKLAGAVPVVVKNRKGAEIATVQFFPFNGSFEIAEIGGNGFTLKTKTL